MSLKSQRTAWLCLPVLAAEFLVVVGFALPLRSQRPRFEPRVVIPQAMPAIVKPPTVNARAADADMSDAELVLGVTIDGHSRAYPINMLTGPRREIINDELGGHAIAATW